MRVWGEGIGYRGEGGLGWIQYASNEILNDSVWEVRSAKKQDETHPLAQRMALILLNRVTGAWPLREGQLLNTKLQGEEVF